MKKQRENGKGLPPKRLDDKFKIDLGPNTKLFHQSIHKLNPLELEKAKRRIERMVEHGFIQPLELLWCDPMLFAPKKRWPLVSH